MVLHTYHAAIADKEFEFPIDLDEDAGPGFNKAMKDIVDEASSTMLAQVQPIACCSCSEAPAVLLLHHPMLFRQVIPPRIEDMPQPVCGNAACAAVAQHEMLTLLQQTVPGFSEDQVCHHCRQPSRGAGKLMQCSRCKAAKYCSADCQKAHWPLHKGTCHPKPTA